MSMLWNGSVIDPHCIWRICHRDKDLDYVGGGWNIPIMLVTCEKYATIMHEDIGMRQ